MSKKSESISWKFFKRAISGDLSDSEALVFKDWLESDAANELYFTRAKKYFNKKDMEDEASRKTQTDQAWHHFRKYVRDRKVKKMYYGLSTAAVLAILVSTMFLLIQNFRDKQEASTQFSQSETIPPGSAQAVLTIDNADTFFLEKADTTISYDNAGSRIDVKSGTIDYKYGVDLKEKSVINRLVIPHGGEFKVRLPDGSLLYVNSETTVEYSIPFERSKREIYVSGEVYIDVAKDSVRPFIVKTDDFSVQALGTAFNVSSYPEDDLAATTLLSGLVEVRCIREHAADIFLLEPDQQLVFNRLDCNPSICQVDASSIVAWTTGYFVFKDETLESIFRKLERWYEFETFFFSEEAESELFTGKLPRFDNLQEILKIVDRVSNSKIELNGKTVVIE